MNEEQKTKKRVRKCHTFNPDVYKPFQEMCKKRDAVPSRVLERFMDKQVRAI